MSSTIRQTLSSALERNTAFGVMIDLQKEFLSVETRGAFENSKRLLGAFRLANVKPLWACWPSLKKENFMDTYDEAKKSGLFKPGWLNKEAPDDFTIALPDASELIITKYRPSALSNSTAKNFIKDQLKPAFIACGVYADKCYGRTIIDMAVHADCDIIVPYNASNFESVEEAKSYFEEQFKTEPRKVRGRIHLTDTDTVIDTLEVQGIDI